jgi:hypothetical protein
MRLKLIAFTIACMVVSGCSRTPSKTEAATQVGKQTASQNPPAKDGAECDEYFHMVSRCIETKMPESERASERQRLDYFRNMLGNSPMLRAAAGPSCNQNIRNEIRNDSYDCYAEEAVKRGIQTPCSLLARTELEQNLQVALEDGIHRGAQCIYGFAGNPARHPFRIKVHWKDGRDELTAARGAQALLNGRLQKETGMSGFVPGATVEGVGDDAFFTLAGIWPMLCARAGDVAVSVEGASQEQLIAIARKALPRIQPDPDANHPRDSSEEPAQGK